MVIVIKIAFFIFVLIYFRLNFQVIKKGLQKMLFVVLMQIFHWYNI